LRVDPTLLAAHHEEAKQRAYHRAVATWNALDSSTRYRIASPGLTLDECRAEPA
jgi:hypothetical protein